jgi:hypothetical protein
VHIFTYYKLKPGVPLERFVEWSRTVDRPVCLAKPACLQMSVYLVEGGNRDDLPTVVEDFVVTSIADWQAAIAAPEHDEITRQWEELADAGTVVNIYGRPID